MIRPSRDNPVGHDLRAEVGTARSATGHLDRLAMVYVRQSSPQQVIENRESRERQYALAEFAQRLGWPAERVVIVDEDQGKAASRPTIARASSG